MSFTYLHEKNGVYNDKTVDRKQHNKIWQCVLLRTNNNSKYCGNTSGVGCYGLA
jgi:hypothetical protein